MIVRKIVQLLVKVDLVVKTVTQHLARMDVVEAVVFTDVGTVVWEIVMNTRTGCREIHIMLDAGDRVIIFVLGGVIGRFVKTTVLVVAVYRIKFSCRFLTATTGTPTTTSRTITATQCSIYTIITCVRIS